MSRSTTNPLQQTGSFQPDEIAEIPRAPGVYQMLNKRGQVIYVGKAINLRARVRQYFHSSGDNRVSIPHILKNLDHIETIITANEKEAFLLENTLIKRHKPRYNVLLRDDKTYVSVRIDPNEKWPRAVVTRSKKRDKALYFGPYTQAHAIRSTLNLLQKIFPLRSCSDHVLNNRSRPCILHQIGRCCAPCVEQVDPGLYKTYLRQTIHFLKGRTAEVVQQLRERMLAHSERLQFEEAGRVRDLIAAIETSSVSQNVTERSRVNRDVIGIFQDQGRTALTLQFVRNGQLVENFNWLLPHYGESGGKTLSQFFGQFYNAFRLIPSEILIPMEIEDKPVIEDWLSMLRNGPVHVHFPQRGEKRRKIEAANQNAQQALERKLSGQEEMERILEDLAKKLHLSAPPERIECFDIATFQGSFNAASQVVFINGEPANGQYRLYKIRSVDGADDFASMREVLQRRFRRVVEENEPPPDLLIVDGGKGQLSMAIQVMADLGLDAVAIAALAKSKLKQGPAGKKDEKIRTEERLFLPNRKNPVRFPPRSPAFYMLQRLRDEAHRFVNGYHRKLRRKSTLRSSLEDIDGVGKARARVLLKHFGSLRQIRQASVEEIAAVSSISRVLAEKIHQHHAQDNE